MKQTKERSKAVVYLRFAAIVVVAGMFGALCSSLSANFSGEMGTAAAAVSDFLYRIGLWLLAAGFVPALVSTGFLLAARGPVDRAQADDAAFEQANHRLELAMMATNLGFPWCVMCVGLGLTPAVRGERLDIAGLGLLFLVCQVVWFMALQAWIIQAVKRIAPEKRGNVFDTRFQKDWYQSCDEAERKEIGDASYFTFRLMSSVYPALMVLLFIAGARYAIHALWYLLLGSLWLLHIGSYQWCVYRNAHKKHTGHPPIV